MTAPMDTRCVAAPNDGPKAQAEQPGGGPAIGKGDSGQPPISKEDMEKASAALVPGTTAGMPPTAQTFFAVVESTGALVRGFQAVSATRLGLGMYQVVFTHDRRVKIGRASANHLLIADKSFARLVAQKDEMFYRFEARANGFDDRQKREVCYDCARARMIDDVLYLCGREAEVYRHDRRAELRHTVIKLKIAVAIEGENCHAVAVRDAEA